MSQSIPASFGMVESQEIVAWAPEKASETVPETVPETASETTPPESGPETGPLGRETGLETPPPGRGLDSAWLLRDVACDFNLGSSVQESRSRSLT